MPSIDLHGSDGQHATQGGSSVKRLMRNAILKCTLVSMGVGVLPWLGLLLVAIINGGLLGVGSVFSTTTMLGFGLFVAAFAILLPAMVFFAAIETRRRSRWVNVIAGICMGPVALFGVGLLGALVMVLFQLLVGPIFGGPLRLEELYHLATILPTSLAKEPELALMCVCLTVPLCLATFARLERLGLRRQILMVVALTPVITGVLSIPLALLEHTPTHSDIRVKEGVSLEEGRRQPQPTSHSELPRREVALVEADYKQALQRALMLIAVCCLLAVMLPVAFYTAGRMEGPPTAIADPVAG